MRGRAYSQEIKNCVFAEGVPARFKKARLGFPAVRKEQRITVQHPAKVDSFIDQRSQLVDFPIVAEVLTHRKHAAEEQCRIDRRDLAVPSALSAFNIEPVI